MSNECFEVNIIGGGLVGPLCALFLSKRGYNINLYERRGDPRCTRSMDGKSINLAISSRGRRALQEIGLEDEILKCGIPMKGRFIHDMNGNNRSILYDSRRRECLHSLSRKDLNLKLLKATENCSNIRLHFNHKLIHVELENGILTFLQSDSGKQIQVKGDLTVGADGAFSTLRKFMLKTPLFNYNQTYLDHGYIELTISSEWGKLMEPNHLHIWPRGKFMMIALPNQENSWTATLFMPFSQFEQFAEAEVIIDFFGKTFPDAVDLIGREQLIEKCLNVKPSSLVSIKCSSFHYGKNTIVIGDAAHAMVPFYGQGTNAGFEDCSILNFILENYNGNMSVSLQKFTDLRKDDAHIICDLAMYNYIEMRDLVTKPTYRLRKALDDILFKYFPDMWLPLYNSVTFSQMSYKQCVENRAWQDKIVMILMAIITIVIGIFIVLIITIIG